MNTLSIRKLHELLQQQHHRVMELYTTRSQIQFVLVFCEQYRNFFMIDLRALPMLADERLEEYTITPIHETTLSDIGMETLSGLYSVEKNNESIPPHFFPLLQKQRMCKIPIHAQSYMKLAFYASSCIFHLDSTFQIEHVRYTENFSVYCVSVDDYYIHQTTLSRDLFKKYEDLFQFMQTSIHRQSNVLSLLFKNTKLVQHTSEAMSLRLEKMQKYTHVTSSLYQRVQSKPHLSNILPRIIDIMWNVFRIQSEYLLQVEQQYFTLTFHTQCILDAMEKT